MRDLILEPHTLRAARGQIGVAVEAKQIDPAAQRNRVPPPTLQFGKRRTPIPQRIAPALTGELMISQRGVDTQIFCPPCGGFEPVLVVVRSNRTALWNFAGEDQRIRMLLRNFCHHRTPSVGCRICRI